MNDSSKNSELQDIIRRLALINAIEHDGTAQSKPVLGKLFSEKPELRTNVAKIAPIVVTTVKEVNNLPFDKQVEIVRRLYPYLFEREKVKVEEKKRLPPLPNVEKYRQIVTRFAPNPDAVLHVGSARAIILSYEYARMYNGTFVLRFEDTDPRLKKSSLQFYDLIREDLKWLGCKWDAEYFQSDRIETYYEIAENLLSAGHAYVCTCPREEFSKKASKGKSCPCRALKSKENFNRWKAMLDGSFGEGEAVFRVKTDLKHPNPAIRDWPAFRIIDPEKYPHPRVGMRYRVWPLFAFANGVDDHLNGVTHIIRGKEHLTNQRRQEYLYSYLGWTYPEAIHYGRLKIVGATLSKSKIVRGVQDGTYTGWDDPRLATFRALSRRGIQPEAIIQLILDIGPRSVDITVSWENLYAYNRKIIDSKANRLFFVQEPMKLIVKGVYNPIMAHIPFHPDYPERGHRELKVNPENGVASLLVSRKDRALFQKGSLVRLMDLFNMKVKNVMKEKVVAQFYSKAYEEARRLKVPLIHWLPGGTGLVCEVVMPNNSVLVGLVEETAQALLVGQIVQFERFGFVKVDKAGDKVIVIYTHR